MCSSGVRIDKQSIFVFLTFCGLISTVFTVGTNSRSKLSEILMNNFVATTPETDISHAKTMSRHERSERSTVNFEQISSIFNAISIGWKKASDHKALRKIDGNGKDKMIKFDSTSISTVIKDLKHNKELDQSEGKYIKGDPLNGYYDMIMTVATYKFWAVLQLFVFLLIIYSAFAAIYYSKVEPIPDYGGTGGRYMRSIGDDPNLILPLLQTTTYGFQFVLDAIERLPQEVGRN